jgi:TetR/AcrR family transcriptional regulator, transcriptional repressor for nem operon
MLISVESMSKAMSLKSLKLRGGWKPWITRPGANSREEMDIAVDTAGKDNPRLCPPLLGSMRSRPLNLPMRSGQISCMMIIMRKDKASIRSAAKEASHERIVQAAARAIRRSGYDGTGVADIMKEAGLTHGAFYAHFESREAMLAEAADRAGAESNALAASVMAAVPPEQALQALMQTYLSKEHLAGIETGCPVSALGSEMPRQSPEVRRAATRRIKEMIDLVARQSPDWGQPGAHERALVMVATMVGTLMLARAVDDPALSDSLCSAALKRLAPSGA